MVSQIIPYHDSFRSQMVSLWYESVKETHKFLKQEDIAYYYDIVKGLDFNMLDVYCQVVENKVIGFIGVSDLKIEMLFVLPEFIGNGIGKNLMFYAIHKLNASFVDVNEQNVKALRFYEKQGFVIYDRTDIDDQGKPYPILKMKLMNSSFKQ